MSSSKRLTCKGTVAGVYLCEAPWPSPPKFRGSSNFVGSETGQIKSVKLLQICSPTGLNNQHPPPFPSHTLSVYMFFDTGKGGGRVEPERRLEEQKFT